MRKIFPILSLIPAAITGVLCILGSGGGFFHMLWLMPLSGCIAGILPSPVLIPVHPAISAVAMLLTGLITDKFYSIPLMLLMLGAAALLELAGYGIGASVRMMASEKLSVKIAGAFSVLLLLTLLFIPGNAVFGNPISGLIARYQLDCCIEANVDMTHYTIDSFGYDWYNGHYRYLMTDNRTGERKNMSLYRNSDKIYFSGTNQTYENLWN